VLRHAEHKTDDLVMCSVPVPGSTKSPPIDDVTHQVEVVTFDLAQKIDEKVGATPARTEVKVGNEYAPIPSA
jgi:hypothetical protein